jgi:hypothetical protein
MNRLSPESIARAKALGFRLDKPADKAPPTNSR